MSADSPANRTRSKLPVSSAAPDSTPENTGQSAKKYAKRSLHLDGIIETNGHVEKIGTKKRHSLESSKSLPPKTDDLKMNGNCQDSPEMVEKLNATFPSRSRNSAKKGAKFANEIINGPTENAEKVKKKRKSEFDKNDLVDPIVRIDESISPLPSQAEKPESSTTETSAKRQKSGKRPKRKRREPDADTSANDCANRVDEAELPLAERIVSSGTDFSLPPPLHRHRSSSIGSAGSPPPQGGDVGQTKKTRHDSVIALLSQALLSGDKKKLDRILLLSDVNVISSTVSNLAAGQVVPLIQQIAARMRLKPEMNSSLLHWLGSVLTTHSSMLSALSATNTELLSLREWLCARASSTGHLHNLRGKIELLRDRLHRAKEGKGVPGAGLGAQQWAHKFHVISTQLGTLAESSDSESDSASDGAGTTDFANEWDEQQRANDEGDLGRDWWDALDEEDENPEEQASSVGSSTPAGSENEDYGSDYGSDDQVIGDERRAKKRRKSPENDSDQSDSDENDGALNDLALGTNEGDSSGLDDEEGLEDD